MTQEITVTLNMNASEIEVLKGKCLDLCYNVNEEVDKDLFDIRIQSISKIEDVQHKATVSQGFRRLIDHELCSNYY